MLPALHSGNPVSTVFIEGNDTGILHETARSDRFKFDTGDDSNVVVTAKTDGDGTTIRFDVYYV